MPRYECDHCGACCNGTLIVEAYDLDVMREPTLIIAEGRESDDANALRDLMFEFEEEFGRCLILACGQGKPCPFLESDNRCSIYPTRPNACVAMEAGDEQCQRARKEMGLEQLLPIIEDATRATSLDKRKGPC